MIGRGREGRLLRGWANLAVFDNKKQGRRKGKIKLILS
jgi:hypothetical protein